MFAVAFAVDGTLSSSPGLEPTAFSRLCEEVASNGGAVPPDSSRVQRAFERSKCALTDGGPALNECIVTAVRDATGVEGNAKALSARYRQIAGQVASEVTHPLPGATTMLRHLESLSVPSAILTNGLSSAERAKAHVLGFTGSIVTSEDIGVKKPDIRAFGALLNALGFPAECVWYLAADFDNDIRPARTAGIRAIWLTQESGTDCVRSLNEFLELTKEPYTRSLLGLRYIMHNALAWRPGHFVPGEEYGLGD